MSRFQKFCLAMSWLSLFAVGCGDPKEQGFTTPSTNANGTDTNNSIDDTATPSLESKEATQAFRVPQRPWDLFAHPDGTIYCSAQGGNKVYIWDPVSEMRSEYPKQLPDVQNLFIESDGTIYFTRTDYGVTGSLSVVDGNQTSVVYDQSDDGFLMRWPMDLVRPPNGNGWVIADYGAGVLFVVTEDGQVSTRDAGSSNPQSLLFVEDTLYVGGESGIYSIDWPDGEPVEVDQRMGLALVEFNDTIWSSNASLGVFEVGGSAVGLQQAARPGSLLQTSDGLYFADHVGEGVWIYRP